MWIRKLSLSLAVSAGLIGGSAFAGIHALEEAIETSTSEVLLPRSVGGVLATRPCDVCALVIVRLAADTRLLIGKHQVTLAEFNKFLESGGPYDLTVIYDKKSFAMNRILVRAEFGRK